MLMTEAQDVAINSFPFLLTPVSTWAHISKGF